MASTPHGEPRKIGSCLVANIEPVFDSVVNVETTVLPLDNLISFDCFLNQTQK